jgi:hypothetical protein
MGHAVVQLDLSSGGDLEDFTFLEKVVGMLAACWLL